MKFRTYKATTHFALELNWGGDGERRGTLNSSLDQEEIILLTDVLSELNFLL